MNAKLWINYKTWDFNFWLQLTVTHYQPVKKECKTLVCDIVCHCCSAPECTASVPWAPKLHKFSEILTMHCWFRKGLSVVNIVALLCLRKKICENVPFSVFHQWFEWETKKKPKVKGNRSGEEECDIYSGENWPWHWDALPNHKCLTSNTNITQCQHLSPPEKEKEDTRETN